MRIVNFGQLTYAMVNLVITVLHATTDCWLSVECEHGKVD